MTVGKYHLDKTELEFGLSSTLESIVMNEILFSSKWLATLT
jgi:hypothetical protein